MYLHVEFENEDLSDDAPEMGITGRLLAMELLAEHYEPEGCEFQSFIVHGDDWDETYHDPRVILGELTKAIKIAPTFDESHFLYDKEDYIAELELTERIIQYAIEKDAKVALVIC